MYVFLSFYSPAYSYHIYHVSNISIPAYKNSRDYPNKDFHSLVLRLPSIHTSKCHKKELNEAQKTKISSFVIQFDDDTIEFCIYISTKV